MCIVWSFVAALVNRYIRTDFSPPPPTAYFGTLPQFSSRSRAFGKGKETAVTQARTGFCLELGMLFRRNYLVIINDKILNKSPSKTMFTATVAAAMVINRVTDFLVWVENITHFGHK